MDWDTFITAQLPSPHTVSVQTMTGEGANGPVFADAVDVELCYVEHKRRRVRVATQDAAGAEVISTTRVFAPPSALDLFAAGSLVTPPGRPAAAVLDVAYFSAAGLDLPEHLEISLE